jgi:hypothetical protein
MSTSASSMIATLEVSCVLASGRDGFNCGMGVSMRGPGTSWLSMSVSVGQAPFPVL